MTESVAHHRSSIRPHLALIAVQLMFSTWPIVGKIALRSFPSTGLVALRVAGAAIAFIIIRHVTKRVPITRQSDYFRLALFSLLGVTLNQLLFVKGLSLSTVVNATLLGTAIPVFTLLVSIVLGKERTSLRSVCGISLATCGVIYLVDPMRADFSADKTLGNLLLVANTAFYGAYIALSQDMVRRYGALTVITWMFAFACVITTPIGGYYLAQMPMHDFGPELWLAVLYIILVPTVAAYYLNAWALARVPPSIVSAYIYLQPLIAFAIAPLLLGDEEKWGFRTAIAALLIFVGVAVATWRTASSAVREVSEHPEALGH